MPDNHRNPLAGQIALVTGASSGIGRAVALALGRAGAGVVVNYMSNSRDAEVVGEEIARTGVRSMTVRADVSDEAAVKAMFERVRQEWGPLDILVANAGLQKDAPISSMTTEQWKRVIDINLTGQFLCAREAIADFRKKGVRPEVSRAVGKIICISSVHEEIAWAGHVNYAASKGGVRMMMRTLAQEVAPDRIRVNSIAPGAIKTPINTGAWETQAARDALLTLIPYGRIGEPDDIARAAVWLASDQADYVVGTTLFVDGGMMLDPGFADNG